MLKKSSDGKKVNFEDVYIEYFFGIAKQVVYDKNWKAKDRPHLIRRIKEKVPNLNMEPIIKMFENLKEKIRKADEFGLKSLN